MRTRASSSRTWNGLLSKIRGPELQHLHRHLIGRLRRHHEHRHVAPLLLAAHALEQLIAVGGLRSHVDHQEIRGRHLEMIHHAASARRDRDVVAPGRGAAT